MHSHPTTKLTYLLQLTGLLAPSLSAHIASDSVLEQLTHITCLGNPTRPLPILPSFDPNTRTMQELCVSTQNGGSRPPFENLGGYCRHEPRSFEPDITGAVEFLPPSHLASARLQVECMLRCFCSNMSQIVNGNMIAVARGTDQQPKYVAGSRNYLQRFPLRRTAQSRLTYQVTIDQQEKYALEPYDPTDGGESNPHLGTYGDLQVSYVRSGLPHWGRAEGSQVSVDQINYIDCEGPMPTFPLPLPWTLGEFSAQNMHSPNAITALCAIYQSGGYFSANAGGYCYQGTYGTEVWFTDEMTPQYSWTWTGGGFFSTAAIRYHCWRHCRCKHPLKGKLNNGTTVRPTSMEPVWDIINDAAAHFNLAQRTDGSIGFHSSSADGPSHSGQVLPPQTGPSPPAGTCGADGKQFCSAPWPSAYAGKPPLTPPEIPNLQFNASSSSVDKCGPSLTCHSPSGCGSDRTCQCVEPDAKTAEEYGQDPVFPSALCLTIASWLMVSSGGGSKRSLNPQLTLNADGEPWRCLCNETYTSTACCTAKDGLVEEATSTINGANVEGS